MIPQLSELGSFFLDREGVADPLERYTQDPAAKFGNIVLLLVFSSDGFEDVYLEEYDEDQKLRYLYRAGPPNRWDATPTAGMPSWDLKIPGDFEAKLTTRLSRLGKSIDWRPAETSSFILFPRM